MLFCVELKVGPTEGRRIKIDEMFLLPNYNCLDPGVLDTRL